MYAPPLSRRLRAAVPLPIAVAALALAGCATGPRYVESTAVAAVPAEGMARVTVYRPDDALQYALRPVRLEYDGKRAAGLPHGGFVVLHVPAGAHVLRADLWDAPGRCELNIDVRAGDTVYVRAAPRAENPARDRKCGGAFSLRVVDFRTALPELPNLRAAL